jgi:hypothetical protein
MTKKPHTEGRRAKSKENDRLDLGTKQNGKPAFRAMYPARTCLADACLQFAQHFLRTSHLQLGIRNEIVDVTESKCLRIVVLD